MNRAGISQSQVLRTFPAFLSTMTFWSEVNLAAMCASSEMQTDIAAFRKKFGVFGEFMDRCPEYTATIASRQLITQIFTAGNGTIVSSPM